MSFHSVIRCLLLALALAPVVARANPVAPDPLFDSAIGADSLMHGTGVAGVNEAAGASNHQANGVAIGVSAESLAAAAVDVGQPPGPQSLPALGGGADARVGDNAFAHFSGVAQINQASGWGNSQANTVTIASGTQAMAAPDDALAGSYAGVDPLDERNGPRGPRQLKVSDSAFEDAHGIVQLNQIAGVGNDAVNHFALCVIGANH